MIANTKVDLLLVGEDKAIALRCGEVSRTYSYTFSQMKSVDELAEKADQVQAKLIVMVAADSEAQDQIANHTQVIKQCCANSYILVVVGKRIPPALITFIKKSGANCIVHHHEVTESGKLDFISLQTIRYLYLPVKAQEFKVGSVVDFNVFHLMPVNRKYLSLIRPGETIGESKKAKMLEVSEVYVKRDDVQAYTQYMHKNTDRSAEGLKSRCRSQYLALTSSFVDLILLITDQSEASSFEAGRKLYEECRRTAKELIISLGAVGDAWDIITNSAVGSFGSLDRAPAVAAAAGLMSLLSEIGQPEDVVLAASLSDIGILDLPPSIQTKMKEGKPLNPEEQERYELHPVGSLNLCLGRRIPIPENLKLVITATHERADGTGFQRLLGSKVPFEAQLIQFCQILDNATSIQWGVQRKNLAEVKKKIFDQEMSQGRFSPLLMTKIKDFLLTPDLA